MNARRDDGFSIDSGFWKSPNGHRKRRMDCRIDGLSTDYPISSASAKEFGGRKNRNLQVRRRREKEFGIFQREFFCISFDPSNLQFGMSIKRGAKCSSFIALRIGLLALNIAGLTTSKAALHIECVWYTQYTNLQVAGKPLYKHCQVN